MHHQEEGLLERVANLGGHADDDAKKLFQALRQGQGQVHAAADFHGPAANAAAGHGVGHQAIGQEGMQGNEGVRAQAGGVGIAHQVFDGLLVVQDHLGFQRVLALGGLAELDQALGVEAAVGVALQLRRSP